MPFLDRSSIQVDLTRALTGGALATAVTLVGMWLSGIASGSDVTALLRDFVPNAQAFTDTIVLASATILALMLTLLGMSSGGESHLKAAHYIRIKQIAYGDTLVFVVALTVGLLLNVPLNESSKLSGTLETVTYYSALSLTALLGGALVSIVLMIYNTVADMIDVLALGKEEHPLYKVHKSGAPPDDEAPQERQEA